jgi:hypothetical protein
MSSDKFTLVSDYSLKTYPCGLTAGSKLRITKEIRCRDHTGKKNGKNYLVGEIWTVLSGVPKEPDVIWLKQADGERHTWDADCIFETFERVDE